MDVRFDRHDNWNGGIDYWTLVYCVRQVKSDAKGHPKS